MSIAFAPLLSLGLVLAIAVLALLVAGFALWRGLAGWLLRGLALGVAALALAGPELTRTAHMALDDIVLVLDDRSASQQSLPDRARQTDAALDHVTRAIATMPGITLERATVGDDPEGTRLASVLNRALGGIPEGRLGGVLVVSDGRLHDADRLPEDLPAPLHLLLTGQKDDWDRRLVIEESPGYGLIGEEVRITIRVEDEGEIPEALIGQPAQMHIAIDGGDEGDVAVPVGQSLSLSLPIRHGGPNVVSFALAPPEGVRDQLTPRNDAAAITVIGVRDRLKVLLVSGEPHAGLRSWRNLLKSDAAVDLVHFTILRPPEKYDGVPGDEMALIAFPVDELFTRRIDDFDLIIFDRYRVRGILPPSYFDNIRRYVEEGGAVLVSSGPEAAGVEGLGYTALGRVMPAEATSGLIETPFLPMITTLGRRHPVTADLPDGGDADGQPDWGPWLRLVESRIRDGAATVMEGDGQPLLVLDRVGEGRIAQLLSDQVWLWGHGFEGGGPQHELLRRIAHWAMAEPELEEEALDARILAADGGTVLRITRRTLADQTPPVTITAPDGTTSEVTLDEAQPGRFTTDHPVAEDGLYRLKQDELERLIAVGPAIPREFEDMIASDEAMAPLIAASGGKAIAIADGLPELRHQPAGARMHGQSIALGQSRPWLGLAKRGAESITGQQAYPLLPPLGWLVLLGGLILGSWLIEGGRRFRTRP